MGSVKNKILEEMTEEFECRYGDKHASLEDIEVIDILYEWLESVDMDCISCLENDGKGSYSIDILFPEDEEEKYIFHLKTFYSNKNYGVEVVYDHSFGTLTVVS